MKICPCCGQDIVIPNELTALKVQPKYAKVLFTLYRAMPDTVRSEKLAASIGHARMIVCRLRECLEDIGSEFSIETDRPNRGYYLNWRKAK